MCRKEEEKAAAIKGKSRKNSNDKSGKNSEQEDSGSDKEVVKPSQSRTRGGMERFLILFPTYLFVLTTSFNSAQHDATRFFYLHLRSNKKAFASHFTVTLNKIPCISCKM